MRPCARKHNACVCRSCAIYPHPLSLSDSSIAAGFTDMSAGGMAARRSPPALAHSPSRPRVRLVFAGQYLQRVDVIGGTASELAQLVGDLRRLSLSEKVLLGLMHQPHHKVGPHRYAWADERARERRDVRVYRLRHN
eukprot:7329699-Prymnesium_polylepis.1